MPFTHRHPVVFERNDASHGVYFELQDLLCRRQSEFQEIIVFDSADHGRVMLIDQQMMFTTTSTGPYNESMAHIPLHLHDDPKRVLIIGGGDGVVLREVLRHDTVEAVVLAELDGAVIKATREFFPDFGAAFDDPRVRLEIGDGAAYVKGSEGHFDISIIDSTDPYLDDDENAVATVLTEPDFYRALQARLGPQGIGIQIINSHHFYEGSFRRVVADIQQVWPHLRIAAVPAYFYISGLWSLGLYSQEPLDVMAPRACTLSGLSHYNSNAHKTAFMHPEDLRQLCAELGIA